MLFRAAIADLSTTGMRVVCDQYLPKDSRYTFTFKRAPFLTVLGEVRWVRAFERDTFQVGVQFVELSDDDAAALADVPRDRAAARPDLLSGPREARPTTTRCPTR